MARNTKVEADAHAPPVTLVLARFVATHPSRGWSDTVDHEDIANLRRKVVATVDGGIDAASADVTVILKDGREVRVFVEHAIGSLERPMSDADLEAKFHSLADEVIGKPKAGALIAACWKTGSASDLRKLAELARP